jgi:predicted MarR family transcription regulator
VARKPQKDLKSPKGKGLDKHWHLASSAFEVGLTELEFSIFRISAAFERWQSDCLACCHGGAFSGTDTALLHVIRMHDRPKSISEMARLLKRDDVSNLTYSVRKLLKAGLVEKSDTLGSKKDVTYQVTPLGAGITSDYAEFRRELLISMTESTAGNVDFQSIATALNLMAAMYDQASCIAATHRVPLKRE